MVAFFYLYFNNSFAIPAATKEPICLTLISTFGSVSFLSYSKIIVCLLLLLFSSHFYKKNT